MNDYTPILKSKGEELRITKWRTCKTREQAEELADCLRRDHIKYVIKPRAWSSKKYADRPDKNPNRVYTDWAVYRVKPFTLKQDRWDRK